MSNRPRSRTAKGNDRNEFVNVALYNGEIFAASPMNVANTKELFIEEWKKHPNYIEPTESDLKFTIELRTRNKALKSLGLEIPIVSD